MLTSQDIQGAREKLGIGPRGLSQDKLLGNRVSSLDTAWGTHSSTPAVAEPVQAPKGNHLMETLMHGAGITSKGAVQETGKGIGIIGTVLDGISGIPGKATGIALGHPEVPYGFSEQVGQATEALTGLRQDSLNLPGS